MKSVIIVTYNSENYINKCLKSVYKNINQQDEVFVIDNNSQDNTLEKISSQPNLKIIQNTENLGFSKAVNQGLKQATGDYLFLINPDTEFEAEVFDKMIAFTETHPQVGIVGCQQIDQNNKPAVSFGKFPNILTNLKQKFNSLLITLNKKEFSKIKQVDWIGGGFTLIKRQVIDKIGLLDEKFFMYYEDVDYCKRAHNAGFEIWHLGEVKINHEVGASSNKNKIKKMLKQSLRYYLQKNKLN